MARPWRTHKTVKPSAPQFSLRVCLLCLFILASGAGCLLPEYQLPHGFSSTYHRYLFRTPPSFDAGIPTVIEEFPVPVMTPARAMTAAPAAIPAPALPSR